MCIIIHGLMIQVNIEYVCSLKVIHCYARRELSVNAHIVEFDMAYKRSCVVHLSQARLWLNGPF